MFHLIVHMRVWCPSNGKLHSSKHGLRCHHNQTWLIELCDKICDQHIRDDANSYREKEFDCMYIVWFKQGSYMQIKLLEAKINRGQVFGQHFQAYYWSNGLPKKKKLTVDQMCQPMDICHTHSHMFWSESIIFFMCENVCEGHQVWSIIVFPCLSSTCMTLCFQCLCLKN